MQGNSGYALLGVAECDKWTRVSGRVEDAFNSFALR